MVYYIIGEVVSFFDLLCCLIRTYFVFDTDVSSDTVFTN